MPLISTPFPQANVDDNLAFATSADRLIQELVRQAEIGDMAVTIGQEEEDKPSLWEVQGALVGTGLIFSLMMNMEKNRMRREIEPEGFSPPPPLGYDELNEAIIGFEEATAQTSLIGHMNAVNAIDHHYLPSTSTLPQELEVKPRYNPYRDSISPSDMERPDWMELVKKRHFDNALDENDFQHDMAVGFQYLRDVETLERASNGQLATLMIAQIILELGATWGTASFLRIKDLAMVRNIEKMRRSVKIAGGIGSGAAFGLAYEELLNQYQPLSEVKGPSNELMATILPAAFGGVLIGGGFGLGKLFTGKGPFGAGRLMSRKHVKRVRKEMDDFFNGTGDNDEFYVRPAPSALRAATPDTPVRSGLGDELERNSRELDELLEVDDLELADGRVVTVLHIPGDKNHAKLEKLRDKWHKAGKFLPESTHSSQGDYEMYVRASDFLGTRDVSMVADDVDFERGWISRAVHRGERMYARMQQVFTPGGRMEHMILGRITDALRTIAHVPSLTKGNVLNPTIYAQGPAAENVQIKLKSWMKTLNRKVDEQYNQARRATGRDGIIQYGSQKIQTGMVVGEGGELNPGRRGFDRAVSDYRWRQADRALGYDVPMPENVPDEIIEASRLISEYKKNMLNLLEKHDMLPIGPRAVVRAAAAADDAKALVKNLKTERDAMLNIVGDKNVQQRRADFEKAEAEAREKAEGIMAGQTIEEAADDVGTPRPLESDPDPAVRAVAKADDDLTDDELVAMAQEMVDFNAAAIARRDAAEAAGDRTAARQAENDMVDSGGGVIAANIRKALEEGDIDELRRHLSAGDETAGSFRFWKIKKKEDLGNAAPASRPLDDITTELDEAAGQGADVYQEALKIEYGSVHASPFEAKQRLKGLRDAEPPTATTQVEGQIDLAEGRFARTPQEYGDSLENGQIITDIHGDEWQVGSDMDGSRLLNRVNDVDGAIEDRGVAFDSDEGKEILTNVLGAENERIAQLRTPAMTKASASRSIDALNTEELRPRGLALKTLRDDVALTEGDSPLHEGKFWFTEKQWESFNADQQRVYRRRGAGGGDNRKAAATRKVLGRDQYNEAIDDFRLNKDERRALTVERMLAGNVEDAPSPAAYRAAQVLGLFDDSERTGLLNIDVDLRAAERQAAIATDAAIAVERRVGAMEYMLDRVYDKNLINNNPGNLADGFSVESISPEGLTTYSGGFINRIALALRQAHTQGYDNPGRVPIMSAVLADIKKNDPNMFNRFHQGLIKEWDGNLLSPDELARGLTEGDLPEEFRRIYGEWLDRNHLNIADHARRTLTDLEEDHGVITALAQADPLLQRVLDIPDSPIADFLIRDLNRINERYHHAVGGRLAVKTAIDENPHIWEGVKLRDGTPVTDGEAMITYLKEGATVAHAFASKAGNRQAMQDMKNLETIIDNWFAKPLRQLEGRAAMPTQGSYNRFGKSMLNIGLNTTFMNKLGGVALNMWNDLAPLTIAMAVRPLHTFSVVRSAILNMDDISNRDIAFVGGLDDGFGKFQIGSELAHEEGIGMYDTGRFMRGLRATELGTQWASEKFANLTGMTWINDKQKRVASALVLDKVVTLSKRLIKADEFMTSGMSRRAALRKAGFKDFFDAGEVNRMGLNATRARRFHKMMYAHGKTAKGEKIIDVMSEEAYLKSKAVFHPDFEGWDLRLDSDQSMVNTVTSQIAGHVHRHLVVTPGVFDKPLWNLTGWGGCSTSSSRSAWHSPTSGSARWHRCRSGCRRHTWRRTSHSVR